VDHCVGLPNIFTTEKTFSVLPFLSRKLNISATDGKNKSVKIRVTAWQETRSA
jgi:hypothetical protein